MSNQLGQSLAVFIADSLGDDHEPVIRKVGFRRVTSGTLDDLPKGRVRLAAEYGSLNLEKPPPCLVGLPRLDLGVVETRAKVRPSACHVLHGSAPESEPRLGGEQTPEVGHHEELV